MKKLSIFTATTAMIVYIIVCSLGAFFRISNELQDVPPDNEKRQPEVRAAQAMANLQNACLTMGAIGGFSSLAAVTAARRSNDLQRPLLLRLPIAVVSGTVVGGLAGLSGYNGGVWFDGLQSAEMTFDQRDMWAIYKTILMYGIFWGAVGGIAGLFAAINCRQSYLKAPFNGVIAGVLAAGLYPLGAGIFFQMSNSGATFPAGGGITIFWSLLCSLPVVAAVASLSPNPFPQKTEEVTADPSPQAAEL